MANPTAGLLFTLKLRDKPRKSYIKAIKKDVEIFWTISIFFGHNTESETLKLNNFIQRGKKTTNKRIQLYKTSMRLEQIQSAKHKTTAFYFNAQLHKKLNKDNPWPLRWSTKYKVARLCSSTQQNPVAKKQQPCCYDWKFYAPEPVLFIYLFL